MCVCVCVCVVLDTSLLNTQFYNVGIKSKVEKSWERSGAQPRSSIYWKVRLRVTVDYGRQLYIKYI